MKLSLKKKFGMIHVRGGRLLRVAHDHQVPTTTQTMAEPERYQCTWQGEKWVTARVGDIAVEIIAVKTGTIIGYSYLAGDAIRLNLYRSNAPAHWFCASKGLRADTNSMIDSDSDPHTFVAGVLDCKYGAADVVVFDVIVDDGQENLRAVGEAFTHAYSYEPEDDTVTMPAEPSHLIGRIRGKTGGVCLLLHFQPPRHKSEHAITGFQNALLLDATDLETFDPWKKPTPISSAG